jgi:hypothetical protein
VYLSSTLGRQQRHILHWTFGVLAWCLTSRVREDMVFAPQNHKMDGSPTPVSVVVLIVSHHLRAQRFRLSVMTRSLLALGVREKDGVAGYN